MRGRSILEKRRYAADNLDHIRRLLVFEPRGHADMYGCFVTEPEDHDGDLGVVFFHNAGYSTACGHGTIAVVTWALESGFLARPRDREAETAVVVDAPSGRLHTTATTSGDRVTRVRFTNVPSFVVAQDLEVVTSRGTLTTDISYGGAFYASVDAAALDLAVEPANVETFIGLGREIKASLEAEHEVVHPEEPELRDVYGVIFFEDLGRAGGGGLRQRNVTVFADGEVDRSPCGSGTSARLALLHAQGRIAPNESLVHDSIIQTTFAASVTGETQVAGTPAVVTEVAGSAHFTGSHQFVLLPHDPLGSGFLLR